jgi:hypothetical protein
MTYIQNLFSSRDNNADGATYVGQTGRLWWNPDTNSLYYSDGTTPGGIAVGAGGNPFDQLLNTFNSVTFANINITDTANIGNLNVSGSVTFANTSTIDLGNLTITDQTIAGTVADRNITLAVNGNANVDVLGGFQIHNDGNSVGDPAFVVATDGQSRFYVSTLDNNAGAVEIVGTTSGSVVAPGNPGVMLHVTGQNNQVSRILNDSVNNYPLYVGRRYNGTALAPTGVLAGQVISRLGANPYLTDAAAFSTLGSARIDFIATEDQTTTAQGSKITMNVTPGGSNVQSQMAEFSYGRVTLSGDLLPSINNTFGLGNNTQKWANVYIGPNSIFIEDDTLGTDAELNVNNGVFYSNGVSAFQVGNTQLTTDGLRLTTAGTGSDINIGELTDTGYMHVLMPGIKFRDDTIQTTAAIPLTQKGAASGVVPLNASTKIDPIYLPSGAISFQGVWNAANNTPTLADGVGANGDEWIVGVAGTQDLGSGNISFAVGDFVLYTAANVWVDIPVGGSGVDTFNGRAGIVTLLSGDVTNALSNGSITNNYLNTDSWELVVGQGIGLTGNATVELGDSITLTNTGVTAAIGGTGVTASAATGNVTLSIGQAVGTGNSVQFAAVTATTTIQATGNITGGNLTTGGRVVATGNISTSGYLLTPNTTINNGVVTTGNVNGGNLIGQNLTPTRVTFVGSGKEIDDDAEFTYNDTTNTLSVGNITASGNVTAAYFSGNGAGLTNTVGGSRYFGSFLSTTTQTNTSVGNALPMTFDTADAWNAGVQIGSPTPNSHIIINNPGVYNLQFSAQLDKTDSGTDTVDIWLSQDGVNVPNTNTTVTLSGNSDKVVAAWNFLVQTTVANSYLQLYWTSTDADLRIFAQGTQINPTRPAIPAVILTVTQA